MANHIQICLIQAIALVSRLGCLCYNKLCCCYDKSFDDTYSGENMAITQPGNSIRFESVSLSLSVNPYTDNQMHTQCQVF